MITTQKGKGSFPFSHPLHIGNWANEPPVRELISGSALVVAVGTRFSYFPTGGWSLRLPERMVHIDIDPAEIGRNYRVEVGVVGDARRCLVAVEAALDGMGHSPLPWRSGEVTRVLQRVALAVGRPVEIEVLDQIRSAVPGEGSMFNDPTTIAFWARSHWKSDLPRTWFVPSGFGTLATPSPPRSGRRWPAPISQWWQ